MGSFFHLTKPNILSLTYTYSLKSKLKKKNLQASYSYCIFIGNQVIVTSKKKT